MRTDLQAQHERYCAQARWTEALRINLLARMGLPANPLLLEVGAGTGCISAWAAQHTGGRVLGIDIHFPTVCFAKEQDPASGYAQADGAALPFPRDGFDLVFSHFLLLWTTEPDNLIAEMVRCTRPGGWVAAFAEPDYGGRIDHPAGLQAMGALQTGALRRQGAAPERGRELRGRFTRAGLSAITAGVMGGEWGEDTTIDTAAEWSTFEKDLQGELPQSELSALQELDRAAWRDQRRILFTPTFYCLGQKA